MSFPRRPFPFRFRFAILHPSKSLSPASHNDGPARPLPGPHSRRPTSTVSGHTPSRLLSVPVPVSVPAPSRPDFIAQLSHARSINDLYGLLEVCRRLKHSSPSPVELAHGYRHLIALFGHYGLWTQLHKTVDELLWSQSDVEIDDEIWASILAGLQDCGYANDAVLAHMLATGTEPGPAATASLLRGATVERNLAQALFLLARPPTASLLPRIPRPTLARLAAFLAEEGLSRLAVDIAHAYLLPLRPGDTSGCLESVFELLRHCVDRSDPESSLYCYTYLSRSHPLETVESVDSGLHLALLSLASRHVEPRLAQRVLADRVRAGRTIDTTHLIPTLAALCQARDRMGDVVELMIRMQPLANDEEAELIGSSLVCGLLGGKPVYQALLSTRSRSSLQAARAALDAARPIFMEAIKRPRPSDQLQVLMINSLMQAEIDLGDSLGGIESYKNLFFDQTHPQQAVEPNHQTLKILLSAAEQIVDDEERKDVALGLANELNERLMGLGRHVGVSGGVCTV